MENIVESLFGLTPFQVQQQQNAGLDSFASNQAAKSLQQRSSENYIRAGGMLGGAGAQAMGMVNPQMEQAKLTEAMMASGGDLSTSQGLMAKSQQFAAAGDHRTALKLALAGKAKQVEEEKAKLAIRQENRKDYAAKPDLEKYAMVMAKRSGLVDGTPEFDDFVSTWMYEQKEKANKTDNPTSYREWQLAKDGNPKLAPYDEWLAKKTKDGAGGGTTVVMPGDKKYAEKRLTDVAEQMTGITKSAESAWKANQALDRFISASGNGTQGGAQPLITATQNFLSSFGYASDALKDTRQMEQAIGDILGSKMVELGARGLTDKDMEILRQALPRVNTDKESRNSVAEILKKANNNAITEYENARTEESRIYPELAGKIPTPAWYRQHKSTISPSANQGGYADAAKAELARRAALAKQGKGGG